MWNFHRAGQLGPYLVIRMVMGILKCLLGRQQNGNTSSLETVNFKILALSTRGSACQGCVSALKVMAAKIARNASLASPRFKEARRVDTPVWPAQESGQRLAHAMERDVASMTSYLQTF